jgi:hypothetical protein
MNDGYRYGEPSGVYLNTIREGYESAGFDMDYLDSAVEKSTELAQIEDLQHSEMMPEQQDFEDMDFDDDPPYLFQKW